MIWATLVTVSMSDPSRRGGKELEARSRSAAVDGEGPAAPVCPRGRTGGRINYFLATVNLNSRVASAPAFGRPVTWTVNVPRAASSAALRVNLASPSPFLIAGLVGSTVTPAGRSANDSVTSWLNASSRLIPIATAFASPCLRDGDRNGTLRV